MSQGEKIELQKCIVALAGPPLVGKSTLGKKLQDRTNLTYLDVDAARRQIFIPWEELTPDEQQSIGTEVDPKDYLNGRSVLPPPWEAFAMINSYQKNHELARELLNNGRPVILGSSYSRDRYHDMLKNLALETASPLKVFLLRASDASIKKRIDERIKNGSLSNVTSFEHYLETKNRYQIMQDVDLTTIDTESPIEDNIAQILEALRNLRILT